MPKSHFVAPYQSRPRWGIAEAESAIAELRASGMSVAAFAAREGIDVQRLHRWRRKLGSTLCARREETSPAFIEVKRGTAWSVEVVLRSGRVVRVAESVDAAALRRIAEALEDGVEC